MGRRKNVSSSHDKVNSNTVLIIVAVIGLVGTIATAVFGFLSNTKPLELTIYTTQTAEAKLTQSASGSSIQPSPVASTTSTPGIAAIYTLTPELVIDDGIGTLQLRLPTIEEAGGGILPDIWLENSLIVSDLRQPETVTYYGVTQQNKEYLVPIYWCAKPSNTLNDNLAAITFEFSANGDVIAEEYVRSYTYSPNPTWTCNSHAVVIGGWTVNARYTLEIKRTLLKDLDDGQSNYSAGEYIYRLVVDVQ